MTRPRTNASDPHAPDLPGVGGRHDDFGGLHRDLPRLLGRRRTLGLLAAGAVTAGLAACGSSGGSNTSGTGRAASSTTPASGRDLAVRPGVSTPAGGGGTGTSTASGGQGPTGGSAAVTVAEETAGPYPGDGTNGPDALTTAGVVRRDIRRSFGGVGDPSGTAAGVPLTVNLRLLDVAAGGRPKAGAAVYVWHCDAAGDYSLYTGAAQSENYLRGVQVTDRAGKLSFVTVFPGAYLGRYPHIHFEVYEGVVAATSGGRKLRTSQIALPAAACDDAYATAGYEVSARNFPQTPIADDTVFADGWSTELATVTGDVRSGMVATLNVGV